MTSFTHIKDYDVSKLIKMVLIPNLLQLRGVDHLRSNMDCLCSLDIVALKSRSPKK